MGPARHPSATALLGFFAYEHLPEDLQAISKPFGDLSGQLYANERLDGAELSVCLRKLLEAKDCAVRAALGRPAIMRGGHDAYSEPPIG